MHSSADSIQLDSFRLRCLTPAVEDMSLQKKDYWKNPTFKLGIRPLLRNFTNRYYAVYAEKSLGNYTNYYKGVLNL